MKTETPSHFNVGGQYAWDSTSLKLAFECPRKYYYKMVQGWQSKHESVHLKFGSIYAAALEHYFKHRHAGLDHWSAVEEVVYEAMILTWNYDLDESGNAIPGTGHPWESGHNSKTRETLIRSIVWYFAHFERDNMTVMTDPMGAPKVEHSFRLPVDGDIIFCGHIDRMVDYGGHPFVMDQKTTTTTISPTYFDQFDMDLQMSMYTFAGKMIFNIPVKGVIIDAAQIAVGFTRFSRHPITRSEGQLNEWYDLVMSRIQSMRVMYQSAIDLPDPVQAFPMNPTACNGFGGCQFRGICSRDPGVRKNFLAGDFVRGKLWNPLESR